ncbi:hypothetical protein BH10PLA2_BH10PLA2_07250 [soil metagenome]
MRRLFTLTPSSLYLMFIVLIWQALAILNTASAAEPEIAFAVKDGFVHCKLAQDGNPIVGAKVKILNAAFQPRYEGETDLSGLAIFPVPKDLMSVVIVELGERVSDPIWIQFREEGVKPELVQLTFGLLPCCKMTGADDWQSPPKSHFSGGSALASHFFGVVALLSTLCVGAIYVGRQAGRLTRKRKGIR